MTGLSIAQPDVTLFLDLEGVIRDVELSTAVPERGVEAWRGRPWAETVLDVGGDKVRRMVEDARTHGVSGFRQVTQRFPSGLELPVEYTTVRLGGKGGLVAIGKNLQAVAELQSRLIAAQQAMERDYWKLREVETRYRLLFDASTEAVLLVRASNLRVIEANPAAIRALGLTPAGRDLLGELAPTDREPFQAMLVRVREHGKAPGVLLHLGREGRPWLVRASLIAGDPGPAFLVQLTPAGTVQPAPGRPDPVPVADLVDRLPDGFVVIDRDGTVLHANRAFLDLVQLGAEGRVLGERLGRWLGRPGADLAVLVANVQRHGAVRLFPTTIHGELGAEIEVELSAVGGEDGQPPGRGPGPRRRPAAPAAFRRQRARADQRARLAHPPGRQDAAAPAGAGHDLRGSSATTSSRAGADGRQPDRGRRAARAQPPEPLRQAQPLRPGRRRRRRPTGAAEREAPGVAVRTGPGARPAFGQADLSNCEREQIHLAGSIQPHGALAGGARARPRRGPGQRQRRRRSWACAKGCWAAASRRSAATSPPRIRPHLLAQPLDRIPVAVRCTRRHRRRRRSTRCCTGRRRRAVVELERAGRAGRPVAPGREARCRRSSAASSLRALCDGDGAASSRTSPATTA